MRGILPYTKIYDPIPLNVKHPKRDFHILIPKGHRLSKLSHSLSQFDQNTSNQIQVNFSFQGQ